MPELLLHYIWLKRLFLTMPQHTTDGRLVEVLNVGQHNLDQGPDFFGATIRIDGVEWTGNVEIHVKSSDWYKHGHQQDRAYDNIILHVVRQADKTVFSTDGEPIPQCELQYPDNSTYLAGMLADKTSVCSQRLFANPALLQNDWKASLLHDRMQKKMLAISQLLQLNHNDWEQAFYITLAHNFGFHTNGLPFELLAKQTPLSYLLKHRNSLFQLEAILYGQSGLLAVAKREDDYIGRLRREYDFLAKKFSLTPLDASLWKHMRMRPQNFPEVRIAQFASLIHNREALFSQMLHTDDLKSLRELFAIAASEEWGKASIGRSAIDVLLINSVIPYKYAWGKQHNSQPMVDSALRLLAAIPAEKNHIVEQWRLLGVEIRNASDSQTFIHLYQDYCIRHRCLSCDVGYQIFTTQPENQFVQTELQFDE